MSVMIVTSLGDIVVDLFTDRCPLTCKNFLKLCMIKYYNGCLFHTVQKDFTAQTGDPTGAGTGGDSIYKYLYGDQARFFGDEIHLDLKHTKTGTVAMASAGENLNASQFYITLRDDLDYLDGKHTVFGEVAEGLETLTRINEAYVDENGRPYKNIRIKHTYILDDPFDDPPQLAELIPDASPEGRPNNEAVDDVRLEDDWVPMDEQLGQEELEEVLRQTAAHSSAVVLESIGDIPDAEIKPPDNVLFVCKLNPVTEDGDLHTIFSRFGTVTSAEVIRDYKTGDSLCYAFIEFEDKEACEQAYFKMDNALIDDRRIHVDFSQSVAKLWSQYWRKGQKGAGGGCFKCGAPDHTARDCPGDSTAQDQRPKYVLKDNNTQRGGGNNSRYEMVFAEDVAGSPGRNKRQRDREDENVRRSIKRDETDDDLKHLDDRKRDLHDRSNKQDSADHLKHPDYRKRDLHDWSGHMHRSREHGEEEGFHGRRSSYGERDRDSVPKVKSDHSRKSVGPSCRDRRDEKEYDRRHVDYADSIDKRDDREYDGRRENDYGHTDRREGKEHEKRRQDYTDRRNDCISRKKSADDSIRESQRHHRTGHRDSRQNDRDESYSRRMNGSDASKGRREERYREKRSLNGEPDRHVDRDQGRRH